MANQDQSISRQRPDPYPLATHIANHLTQAWNAGDGQAFAQPFAENADFVTVFGELIHSRQTIGQGHDSILNTLFKGTQVQYTVRDAAWIDTNTVLAHVNGTTLVAKGAIANGSQVTITLIIQPAGDMWLVRAFHNTTVSDLPNR